MRCAFLAALVLCSACATPGDQATAPAAPPDPIAPGPIIHVVLVRLRDPADRAQLVAESDTNLARIPSVRSWFCGTPFDAGRGGVVADYDVALCMRFDDEAGYRAYLEDPHHVAYVERWSPRCDSIVIRDAEDPTP